MSCDRFRRVFVVFLYVTKSFLVAELCCVVFGFGLVLICLFAFCCTFFQFTFSCLLNGVSQWEEREAGLHFPSSPNNFTFFPWFPMNKFPFFLTFVASSRRQKIYLLLPLNNRVTSFVSFSKEITMRSCFQNSQEVLPILCP